MKKAYRHSLETLVSGVACMPFSFALTRFLTNKIVEVVPSCHRLKQMAKPAGTAIRERNTTLGAFGNVLNVRAKV